jgi:putative endonuclease
LRFRLLTLKECMRLLSAFLTRRFSRLLNTVWTPQQQEAAGKAEVGRRGEAVAGSWLRVQGCKVLYRNYRAPDGGELDIVCRHGKVLAFVEVKTRTSTAFGRPGHAVTIDKQALILRGASAWLRLLGCPDIAWRYDVVEVLLIPGQKPQVNWIQAAFNTDELAASLRRKAKNRA